MPHAVRGQWLAIGLDRPSQAPAQEALQLGAVRGPTRTLFLAWRLGVSHRPRHLRTNKVVAHNGPTPLASEATCRFLARASRGGAPPLYPAGARPARLFGSEVCGGSAPTPPGLFGGGERFGGR